MILLLLLLSYKLLSTTQHKFLSVLELCFLSP